MEVKPKTPIYENVEKTRGAGEKNLDSGMCLQYTFNVDSADSFALSVITNADIPFFFRASAFRSDGTVTLTYDTSGYESARSYLASASASRIYGLFCGICDAAAAAEDHMIDGNLALITPDRLFAARRGEDGTDVKLICLPVIPEDVDVCPVAEFTGTAGERGVPSAFPSAEDGLRELLRLAGEAGQGFDSAGPSKYIDEYGFSAKGFKDCLLSAGIPDGATGPQLGRGASSAETRRTDCCAPEDGPDGYLPHTEDAADEAGRGVSERSRTVPPGSGNISFGPVIPRYGAGESTSGPCDPAAGRAETDLEISGGPITFRDLLRTPRMSNIKAFLKQISGRGRPREVPAHKTSAGGPPDAGFRACLADTASGKRYGISALPVRIGMNGKTCGIVPEGCRAVSREHAMISCENGRYRLTDLGSTNGSYLNGIRIFSGIPVLISPGDEIILGDLKTHFETSGRISP